MTWFSLPVTQIANTAEFSDAPSAGRWLAEQPQANALAMLSVLQIQIEAFNVCVVAPSERYATLEVLRKSVFTVCADNRRRYEYRALPLLPAEQAAFDSVARLWRACSVAYLHCLRACLEGDAALLPLAAEVTQRALCCLRSEQMNGYLAGSEPAADFWVLLHAVWASAEQLECTRQPVTDRLSRETLESTATGQYGLALLLHLARPFSLSRTEFAACARWLVRWRELVSIEQAADAEGKSHACALDLASAQPIVDAAQNAGSARWLVLRGVMRKIRQRLERLAGGESPESLKLGSSLSLPEFVALLKTLDYRLSHPQIASAVLDDGEPVLLAVGLENCYRQLGGAPLDNARDSSASSSASQLVVEQIAVFGHAVRAPDRSSEHVAEVWRLVAQNAGQLQLTRAASSGEARVVFKGVLAVRLPQRDDYLLVTAVGLYTRPDGTLCVDARRLAGQATPLQAEVRDKRSGQASRHAALLLSTPSGIDAPQLFVPAGLAARALAIRFYDGQGQLLPDLRLDACLDHGSDNERWTAAV